LSIKLIRLVQLGNRRDQSQNQQGEDRLWTKLESILKILLMPRDTVDTIRKRMPVLETEGIMTNISRVIMSLSLELLDQHQVQSTIRRREWWEEEG